LRPRSSEGRAWWLVAALALATVQLPVLLRTGADPSQSDFANYYAPAWVLARGGDVGALYDRDTFATSMAAAGLEGLGSFVPHPPANALWLLPLAFLPAAAAKALWSAALVGALALTVAALARLGGARGAWEMAVIVLAPTLAVRNALAFGQPYPFLAALLAGGALALERGRDFVAGVLLGLGVSFKPYALGLGFLFLGRGRRRALAGFVCGAVLPSLLLAALTGVAPFSEFAVKVFPWMVRGEIQDPFSPVWGSVSALSNRLFRFEADLNPHPWVTAPLLARFAGAAVSTFLLALGVFSGRRALDSGRAAEAVAMVIAFSLAASPFGASYHLVLLALPVAVMTSRWRGAPGVAVVLFWAILGSSALNVLRAASGPLAPLAYARVFGITALALGLSWAFLNPRVVALALAVGALAGGLVLRWDGREESWARVESARGYSMMKPYFCGSTLRWLAPSADGRRLESHGAGEDCPSTAAAPALRSGASVVSRFAEGSWDLYLRDRAGREEMRLTHSRANEIDPVLEPAGCAVVFASDQGRGLGSTALYRLDLSPFIEACAGPAPAAGRP
jgi:hypothetical protein